MCVFFCCRACFAVYYLFLLFAVFVICWFCCLLVVVVDCLFDCLTCLFSSACFLLFGCLLWFAVKYVFELLLYVCCLCDVFVVFLPFFVFGECLFRWVYMFGLCSYYLVLVELVSCMFACVFLLCDFSCCHDCVAVYSLFLVCAVVVVCCLCWCCCVLACLLFNMGVFVCFG